MSAPRPRHRRRGSLRAGVGAVVCAAMTFSGVVTAMPAATAATDTHPTFSVNTEDLRFILKQIRISEAHAAGGPLLCPDEPGKPGSGRMNTSGTCVPDPRLPWGLRTVDGSFNNLMPGQSHFGAGGQRFPRILEADFKDAERVPVGAPGVPGSPTSYQQTSGMVYDSQPRIVSNLIVDQTAANPAAEAVYEEMVAAGLDARRYDHDGDPGTPDRFELPNVSPDEGLSAPFSSWFTIFGQFFDHGLDLVSKGGNGTVIVPLLPGDPLYREGRNDNFIPLTRATNDGGSREHINRTTPFVDQNQTYTSHAAHQVFLREYELVDGRPRATGHLLDGADGGLATWNDIKAQARDVLGIELVDMDVHAVPLVESDAYGNFVPGTNGFPQLHVRDGATVRLVTGTPAAPQATANALRVGHAFLDDIAHSAAPSATRSPDPDDVAGGPLDEIAGNLYDDELLGIHFITGDGRGNENIALTAVHHVFHSEHNRVVEHVKEVLATDSALLADYQDQSRADAWDYEERLFQAARYVTEMEYQHLVFEEFARTIQPTINVGPLNETLYHADVNPAISAEFAHVVYRFGHSMLNDTVAREGFGLNDISLFDGFLNPAEFAPGDLTADEGAAAIIAGMTRQTGNGIDEFVDDTLRNQLLGLPLDLATINLTRARDAGVPGLQAARAHYYEQTSDSSLKPYGNWQEFELALKHRQSIQNFIAAYAPQAQELGGDLDARRALAAELHADEAFMQAPASETGVDDIDFWMGGLAERPMIFGGMLGTTFNAVFEQQLEDLQNADRFYYLTRNQGLNLFAQLEANSFSELAMRNTDVDMIPGNIFANPDVRIDLDDPADRPAQLVRLADGTYRWDGAEHVVIRGTTGADRIAAGDGDDTIWGREGNDNLEGGIGNDMVIGGDGNDIITDLFGDDTLHGDRGHDVIHAGPGADLVLAGSGKDAVLLGDDDGSTAFAGWDDDFVRGGRGNNVLAGNEGDDWMEGGQGHDLVQGDNALTFQNDPVGGHDVLFGGPGNDDHDAEGGDDIMLNNGIDRHAGMFGFDWVTHQGDPFAADSDMGITIFQPENVQLMRSRFMSVEGISGGSRNDILRGVGRNDEGLGDHTQLTQEHLDRVVGLRDLLGGGADPVHARPFYGENLVNNIMLGGSGSDLIEPRGGNDFIDGDAVMNVYIEGPGGERQTSLQPYMARLLNRSISPDQLQIVRVITTPADASSVDTLLLQDVRENYEVTVNADGTRRVAHVAGAGGTGGNGDDGVNTIRNIERLSFTDEEVMLADVENFPASGTFTFAGQWEPPTQGAQLSVTASLDDGNGIDQNTVVYRWQVLVDSEWVNTETGLGRTFVPTNAEAGLPLRVIVTFTDGHGVVEQVASEATAPVDNVNDPATAPTLSSATAQVGDVLTALAPTDPDGTTRSEFSYQWESQAPGAAFVPVAGATSPSLTVTQAMVGQSLRVRVTFVDDGGTAEDVVSSSTSPVTAVVTAPAATAIGQATGGDASVTVTWTAPASDGGSALTGYEVRVVDAEGAQVGALRTAAAGATSLVVTGLANGTAYRFQVRAVNAVGAGGYSELSAAVTPAAPVVEPPVVEPPVVEPPVVVPPAPALLRNNDFSGDGAADVLARSGSGQLFLFRTNGTGGWLGGSVVGNGWNGMTAIVAPGDFSGDGIADVLARNGSGQLFLYRGNGTGGWLAPTLVGTGWNGMTAIVAPGDFSGDGKVDLLARNSAGQLFLYRGNGAGGWAGSSLIGSGWNGMTAIVAPGDFSGDGKVDLLARNSAGQLFLYRGNGTGGWAGSSLVGTGWNGFTSIVGPGDFNGDGKADVLARNGSGQLFLYRGNGAGGWSGSSVVGTGWNPFTAIVS